MSRDWPDRPTLAADFYKAHGLGNDYLVFGGGDAWTAEPAAVARVCDRWRGPGSDGIVCHPDEVSGPVHRLRMFNPDGSEFERSGNGLRVLAAWLARRERVEVGEPFRVSVGGDDVEMEVLAREKRGRYDVRVDMGRALVGPEVVDADVDRMEEEAVRHPAIGLVTPTLVSVGNPHAVCFVDDFRDPVDDEGLFRTLGPFLTRHPAFPRGINVQLVRREAPGRLRALVWERGVGETSASGTSACAVGVAAVRRELAEPGEIEVRMEGGTLRVEVDAALGVRLRGPVEEVYEGRLTEGFLASLGSLTSGPA